MSEPEKLTGRLSLPRPVVAGAIILVLIAAAVGALIWVSGGGEGDSPKGRRQLTHVTASPTMPVTSPTAAGSQGAPSAGGETATPDSSSSGSGGVTSGGGTGRGDETGGGGGDDDPATAPPMTVTQPQGLSASAGGALGEVRLQWGAPAASAADVAKYRVYRGGSLVGTVPVPGLAYVNVGLDPQKWCYQVRAVDRWDREGPPSAEACSCPKIPALGGTVQFKEIVTLLRPGLPPRPFKAAVFTWSSSGGCLPVDGTVAVHEYEVNDVGVPYSQPIASEDFPVSGTSGQVIFELDDCRAGIYLMKLSSGLSLTDEAGLTVSQSYEWGPLSCP